MKDKFHLQYSCNHNRVNAPDGEYIIKHEMYDWTSLNVHRKSDDDMTIRDYFSKNKVIVRGGLVDIATLEDCYREIQSQHNYHGVFIESIGFDGEHMTIGMGS